MKKPKVSILCLAYNHGKFIRQALDGFIMQKTNFPFEVLIHDDASTDETADIIREYEKKYPEIIKPIYQKENQCSQKIQIEKTFQWPRIQGKYVALNEGDDYWIDENKLQKQVDFLDSHPDFNVCFHPVKVIWDDQRKKDSIFPSPRRRFYKEVLTLGDLLQNNFIQTNSVMYRWHDISKEWPEVSFLPGDYMVHLLQTGSGKIGFLPDVMSVYRRNSGGIWTGSMESDSWFEKCAVPHLRFYQEVEKKFHADKTPEKIYLLQKAIFSFLKNKKFKEIESIAAEFPDIWDKLNFSTDTKLLMQKIKRLKTITLLFGILILVLFCLIFFIMKGF